MTEPHRLTRLFTPRTVAVVGASEKGMRSRNAIEAMTAHGIDLHLVNRRGDTVLGHHTLRSLTEVAESGVDIDAAIVFTNAAAAVDVTREAAELGVGGVVINAGGFAEAGGDGVGLQEALAAAAGSMPVLGPNCNGLISPSKGLHLAGSPTDLPIRDGKLAFVTHSGATMLPMGIAGDERWAGFSYLVSTGNEAVVDMAEVIDYLATDSDTAAICLLIETVRRPDAFWQAVDRAIDLGKPLLALKNGRSDRGQAIARSHTGAVAGEAWIYEAALRQHGVIVAEDLVDLADRAVLFDQVPAERWTRVGGLAVASGSGGWVTMASDVCAEEGIEIPALDSLAADIRRAVPEASVVNPLDSTGTAMTDPSVMASVLDSFIGSPEVDTTLLLSTVTTGAEGALHAFTGTAPDLAPTTDKLIVVGSIEGGPIGPALQRYREAGVAVTRGLRATIRALASMAEFVGFEPDRPAATPAQLSVPAGVLEHPKAGTMLSFAATMELLAKAGVPTAPYSIVGETDSAAPEFDGPYVVKLADVPHRTDIGAVRLGVGVDDLAAAVKEMRDIAAESGESPVVVIQPQYAIKGEVLVGINADNELGPVVVCGLGGIYVEVLKKVTGRLAPFGDREARAMIAAVNDTGALDGPRGTTPWPVDQLATLLQSVSAMAAGSRTWLETLDINPLALTDDGIVAVDGLAILRDVPKEEHNG